MLKGQDLLVAFYLAEHESETLATGASRLGLSAGEMHNAVQRLKGARLLLSEGRRVHRPFLIEFAVHGARFAFAPVLGRRAGGIPTAQSAHPLHEQIVSNGNELVWKHPRGSMRAQTLEPIYPSAPDAALRDSALYRKLALLDGIRVGGTRVKEMATDLLVKELSHEV